MKRAALFLILAGALVACEEPQRTAGQVAAVADTEAAARLYRENYVQAATAQNAGDYSVAEKWHRTNLTLVESAPGLPPEFGVLARCNLASAVMMQGRLDEAEALLHEAQGVLDAVPQIEPTIKAYLLANWGGLKGKQHQFELAEEMLKEGLAILEDTDGLRNEAAASGQIELARIQVQLGKLESAEGNYRHALRIVSELGFPESNPYFVEAMGEHEALQERLGIQ